MGQLLLLQSRIDVLFSILKIDQVSMKTWQNGLFNSIFFFSFFFSLMLGRGLGGGKHYQGEAKLRPAEFSGHFNPWEGNPVLFPILVLRESRKGAFQYKYFSPMRCMTSTSLNTGTYLQVKVYFSKCNETLLNCAEAIQSIYSTSLLKNFTISNFTKRENIEKHTLWQALQMAYIMSKCKSSFNLSGIFP